MFTLVLTFISFEKAFDMLHSTVIMEALIEQEVNATFIEILTNIYKEHVTLGKCKMNQ